MSNLKQKLTHLASSDWGIALLITCAVVFLLFQLKFALDRLSFDSELTEMGELRATGEVRRRHAANLSWENLSGVKQFFLKDTLYTGENARMFLVFNNSEDAVLVEPNTMIRIEEVIPYSVKIQSLYGKAKSVSLASLSPKIARELSSTDEKSSSKTQKALTKAFLLEESQVDSLLQGKPASNLLPNNTGTPRPETIQLQKRVQAQPLILRSSELSSFGSAQRVTLPDLSLAPIMTDLENLMKRADKFARRRVASIKSMKLEIPPNPEFGLMDFVVNLIYPASDSTVNPTDSGWVQLEWSPIPVADVTYEIQLSTDREFKDPMTFPTHSNSARMQVSAPGNYFWRVIARKNGTERSSRIASFRMESTKPR